MTTNIQGVELETTEITVRLGTVGFARLTHDGIDCSHVWLSAQPDGTFALGVVTDRPPVELGLQARAVEADDRQERFS